MDSTSYEYCVVVLVFSKLLEFLNKPIWWKLLSETERKRERRGERELVGLRGASRTGTAPRQYRGGLRKGALKPPFRSRESPPSGRVFTRPSLSSTPRRLTGSSQAEVTASIV